MALPSIAITRATALQLGAVAAIGIATVASGGTLAPLLVAAFGMEGAKKAGEAVLGFAVNVLSGIFGDEVKSLISAADKAHRSKQNHDVQGAINTAIAKCVADAADSYTMSTGGKEYLKSIAAAMTEKPLSLQLTPGTDAIDEVNVTAILTSDATTIRERKPLTAKQWEVLVGQYAHALGKETMQVALEHAALHLEGHFSTSLVQVLKDLGAETDPAWFAVVLRFLGEIHADVKQTKAGIAAIKADTHAQSVNMGTFTAAFNAHQREVRDAFEKLYTACTQRVTTVSGEQLAADREQLAYIHSQAQTLAIDLPAMKSALDQVNNTLAAITKLLTEMASAVFQVRDLLAAYGMVGLVSPNLPRLPEHLIARDALLSGLRDTLTGKGRTVITGQAVTRGSGGQGKTILAQWYAQVYKDQYKGGRFQVGLENQSLARGLASLLTESEATRSLNEFQKARMVVAKLSQEPACLLILDNLPDEAAWTALSVKGGTVEIEGNTITIPPLLPALPCDIIITTRAEHLAGVRGVDVGGLSDEEGAAMLALFARDFDLAFNEAAAKRITRELGGLALAVAAVGAHMALDHDGNWSAYADRLAAIPLDALPDARKDIRAVVGYTGRITAVLDALYDTLPPAEQRAMDYAALLSPDQVPGVWLTSLLTADAEARDRAPYLSLGTKPSGVARTSSEVIEHLILLGVVSPAGENGRLLQMHRLHAKRSRERAGAARRDMSAHWSAIAVCAKARTMSVVTGKGGQGDGTINNPAALTDASLRWELTPLHAVCRALWQQADAATAQGDEPARVRLVGAAAGIGVWLAGVLYDLGRFAEAAACLLPVRAHEAAVDQVLGAGRVASCYTNLQGIQRALGDTAGAMTSAKRAIEIAEGHHGEDHQDVAAMLSNLALIQQAQGDLPGALASIERAIAIEDKHFAPDHPTFATSYSNLATIQYNQDDLPGALASTERAIAIKEKHFVPDHPTFATSYSNLALIQQDQGDLPGARASIQRAIAIKEKHFSPDHPTFAISYSNLAGIQQDQGDLPGARASMERAIAIEEKHFASDHPTFATSYNNLAHICADEGDRAAACANFKKAMAIFLKHFDENHPNVKCVRANMKVAGCGQ